jgi:hypothetical protein
MVTRNLLPGRSTSMELTPADFSRSRNAAFSSRSSCKQLGVALLGEPARAPGLIEAQPESVRMNFLSHLCFLLRHLNHDMRRAALVYGRRGPSAPAERASCAGPSFTYASDTNSGPRPGPRTGWWRWRWPIAAPSPRWARCACWCCAAVFNASPPPACRGSGPRPGAPFCGETRMYLASALTWVLGSMLAAPLCRRLGRFLRGRLHRVAFKDPGGRELAELVPHHILGDVHRNELLAVVDRDGITRRTPAEWWSAATRCGPPSSRWRRPAPPSWLRDAYR